MSFARNLLRVLVEKRLWPIALALVVALVAIPVIGAGGGDAAGADEGALPIAPTDAVSAKTLLELHGPPSVNKRPGGTVDPFRRPPKAKELTTSTTSTAEAASGSTGVGGLGGSGGAGGLDAGTPVPDEAAPAQDETTQPDAESPAAASLSPRSVYRTTVRWSAGDSGKAQRILRLTPLGGVSSPSLLYLGVDEDGKHALFLLGPGATSTGEADCPDAECRVVSLAKGDSQIVDVQSAGAALRQFELELVSVERDELSSAARAARARAKEHVDGRDVLRSLIQAGAADVMGAFAFDPSKGVMVVATG